MITFVVSYHHTRKVRVGATDSAGGVKVKTMSDLFYVVVVLIFFAVAAAFSGGCDTLLED
jgi:hypothetical protein